MTNNIEMQYSTSFDDSLLVIQMPKATSLNKINRAIVNKYYLHYNGNVTKVARLLGIARQTVYNWKDNEAV